jgi:hypothetical protein
MKRMILVVGVVAATLLSVSSASAAGLNLAWQNCIGDGGTNNRTSACALNLGSAGTLVSSFQIDGADVPGISGLEILIDFVSADATMPAWWNTACRNFLSANPTISGAAVNCFDWANGAAAGGLAGGFVINDRTGRGPNTARVLIGYAVASNNLQTVPAGVEMFASNLLISNVNTTTCTGCATPMCIAFVNLRAAQGINTGFLLNTAQTAGSNTVTWQGSGADCSLTPTRNATWSSVKSLYR